MAKHYLNTESLKIFIPLRNLTPIELERVSRNSPIHILANHKVLYKPSTPSRHYVYLVKGKVALTNEQGQTRHISSDMDESHFPLVLPPKSKDHIQTVTKSIILRIEKDLLGSVNQLNTTCDTILVDEIQLTGNEIENKIFHELYENYENDSLTLPSLPDLALRIRSAVQNPNTTTKAIARILQVDPAITVKVLQIANSPLYRGVSKIQNLSDAVSRLGFEGTKNIVMSFILGQLFHSKHQVLRKKMQLLWRHCAEVAAMGYILAKVTKGFDPDYAMMAGILHDIGTVVILTHAENYADLITEDQQLDRIVDTLRGPIGAMLLKKWGFDEALVTVAAESENWLRDPAQTADYCDIILLAQLHSYIGTARMHQLPAINEVPAFSKIALGKLSPQRSLLILDKAKIEISNIKQLLGTPH